MKDIPGIRSIEFTSPDAGPGGPAIELLLSGPEFEVLRQAAVEIEDELSRQPGVRDIRNDFALGKPEVKIRLKPGSENLGNSHEVRALTQKVHDNGGICAAICAAPALTLARFGMLDDRTATCYPSFEKHFDASTTHSEERVVVDSGIVTSRGAGTSMEFALRLVALLAGEARAEELRKGVLA